MQGYMLTLFTSESQRCEGSPAVEWLLKSAKGIGINGATVGKGTLGYGPQGKTHSTHFFETADDPVAVSFACDETQCKALLDYIANSQIRVFYVKTPAEFGEVGTGA